MKPIWAAPLALTLGLVVGPVASLYCDVREAASMACCKGDMDPCKQTAKTMDCCQNDSPSRDSTLGVVKSTGPWRHRSLSSLMAPASAGGVVGLDPGGASRVVPSSALSLLHSPPLRTVLRL